MYADLPKSVIKIERFVLRQRRRYGEVPAPSVLDKIERDRELRQKGHKIRLPARLTGAQAVAESLAITAGRPSDPYGPDLFA
jgi:hypothetical protein